MHLVDRNETPNGYQLLNARHVGRHEASDIIALATEIQNADAALRNTSSGKLSLILDQVKNGRNVQNKWEKKKYHNESSIFVVARLQIRFLQMQARKILDETKTNQGLHAAACNFRKVPGKLYHLYERESGQTYFSMLSPAVIDISKIFYYLDLKCFASCHAFFFSSLCWPLRNGAPD